MRLVQCINKKTDIYFFFKYIQSLCVVNSKTVQFTGILGWTIYIYEYIYLYINIYFFYTNLVFFFSLCLLCLGEYIIVVYTTQCRVEVYIWFAIVNSEVFSINSRHFMKCREFTLCRHQCKVESSHLLLLMGEAAEVTAPNQGWALQWNANQCIFLVSKYCSIVFRNSLGRLNTRVHCTQKGKVKICISAFGPMVFLWRLKFQRDFVLKLFL